MYQIAYSITPDKRYASYGKGEPEAGYSFHLNGGLKEVGLDHGPHSIPGIATLFPTRDAPASAEVGSFWRNDQYDTYTPFFPESRLEELWELLQSGESETLYITFTMPDDPVVGGGPQPVSHVLISLPEPKPQAAPPAEVSPPDLPANPVAVAEKPVPYDDTKLIAAIDRAAGALGARLVWIILALVGVMFVLLAKLG